MSRPSQPTCRQCVHFSNAPAVLEQALPGLRSMASAWASVRSSDGVCQLHDRYLSAEAGCAQFSTIVLAARQPSGVAQGTRRPDPGK